jgi:protein TonB
MTVSTRPDILDERDSLRQPLLQSVGFHILIGAVVIGVPLLQGLRRHEPWGDASGGGGGAIAVNVVNKIPLPGRTGPVNPVANPTESTVPTPPPKAREQRKAAEPDPDAIPLKGRDARRTARESAAAPNRWRAQQRDLPNQMYSQTGGALVSPMVGQMGSGGVGFGTGSVFGRRFGNYASVLRDAVARKWNTADVDPRIRSANQVIVTFTILRSGQVRSVRTVQRSGIPLLDTSCERAIYDASPFPPLPAEYEGSEANIEFVFELRR